MLEQRMGDEDDTSAAQIYLYGMVLVQHFESTAIGPSPVAAHSPPCVGEGATVLGMLKPGGAICGACPMAQASGTRLTHWRPTSAWHFHAAVDAPSACHNRARSQAATMA